MIRFFAFVLVSAFVEEESLRKSDGSWHRSQRGALSFSNGCFYYDAQGCDKGSRRMKQQMSEPDVHFVTQKKERAALNAIYDALDGPNWVSSFHWGSGWPCLDGWYGVVCNENGFVMTLNLADNRLKGEIPDDINDLVHIRRLNVASAPVIHSWKNENRNHITGKLPNMSNLADLREVELSNNELTELPFIHLNKATLELLACTHNKLKTLPQVLWSMFKLELLDLSNNEIESDLPDLLGQGMWNVWYLSLASNKIKGEISGSIRTMTKMKVFDVRDNVGITKYWPQGVVWQEIEYLAISGTSLTSEPEVPQDTPSSVPSLCLDVPFCFKYMWDTHGDFSNANYADFASNMLIQNTLELAKTGKIA